MTTKSLALLEARIDNFLQEVDATEDHQIHHPALVRQMAQAAALVWDSGQEAIANNIAENLP